MSDQIIIWFNSMSNMERFFFFYFTILIIIWLVKIDHTSFWPKSFSSFNKEPKYELALNKKAFVIEVVRWGLRNISYEGVEQKRKSVNVQVSYYDHKKLHGVYYSSQNTIKIYVNNHQDIDQLIDSTLHEVIHAFQLFSDKQNFQKRYSRLLQEKTYAKHPMEIEARKLAAANTQACKEYLIAQGKLRITHHNIKK